MNVRALRLDGKHAGVRWFQADYDSAAIATARLIAIFSAHPLVNKVFFNDSKVPKVFPLQRHDDHFHIEVRV